MKQEPQTPSSRTINAYKLIVSGNYIEAISLYEEAIALEPEIRSNYGYLGLALLLEGREIEAQMSWFNAVDDPKELDDWVTELEEILNTEAERYSAQSEIATSWLIRQHLAEISPQNLYNFVELAKFCLEQPLLDPDEQNLKRLIEVLENYSYEFSSSKNLALPNLVEQILVNVIPPRQDAKIWRYGNTNALPHPRDQNLHYIHKHGRKKWKYDSGYHRCSLQLLSQRSSAFKKPSILILTMLMPILISV